jgi:transcriptional regulator with XRE-family HTH domain
MPKPLQLPQLLAVNVLRAMERDPSIDTQQKLAARSGLSQQHVSRILRAEVSAGLEVIGALAKALRCQPWELLVDEEATRQAALERMIVRNDPKAAAAAPAADHAVVVPLRKKRGSG